MCNDSVNGCICLLNHDCFKKINEVVPNVNDKMPQNQNGQNQQNILSNNCSAEVRQKTTKNVQCKTDALLMKNKVQGERNLRPISHEQCFLFYYVVFFFVFIKENEKIKEN